MTPRLRTEAAKIVRDALGPLAEANVRNVKVAVAR